MRRRRRAREGQEKRKRENRRPILKMLCAALLRSFRGQHSEKMKGSAQGTWDLREGQQPFRPNPNGAGDRTTTLRRLLIGADNRAFVSQDECDTETERRKFFLFERSTCFFCLSAVLVTGIRAGELASYRPGSSYGASNFQIYGSCSSSGASV